MNALPHHCRERFQPSDFAFLVEHLAADPKQTGALQTLLQDQEALDALLDDPRLLQALLELTYPLTISPEFYFYVLVRHSLEQAGGDTSREVADYIAATLAEYARGNPLARDSAKLSVDFTYQIDFWKAFDHASPYEQYYLHVRCGNQFLVLTGLFPEFLERRRDRRGAPAVRHYEEVASSAYRAASDHPLACEFALEDVYRTLSESFGETRRALNRLASDYLFLHR